MKKIRAKKLKIGNDWRKEYDIPIRVLANIDETEAIDLIQPFKIPIRKTFGYFALFFRNAFVFGAIIALTISQASLFSAFEAHVINVTAEICKPSEIRSMGYWKNHPGIYAHYLPQNLGDEIIDTVQKVEDVFGADNSVMKNKLKKQLLAMKFNIVYFGIGDYMVESEGKTLNHLVAEADDLLRQNPPPSDLALEKMKDLLDYLNNFENIKFCSVAVSPKGCELRLTKTADSDKIDRGDTITYSLTLDNIGDEVCTGSGVKLKDDFDGNLLEYLNYTSVNANQIKSFEKSKNYIEWNFGNVYPNDPLIDIDLKMKVKNSAQCDSTITNTVNYWSNETNWGDPTVTVGSKVICEEPSPIVINEFLPNPSGSDKAAKPNGEWVELYNKGVKDIDVAGWMLYDENDKNELPITSVNTNTGSTIVGAGGFMVVYRNGDSDFALDNIGGDAVRLYNGEIKNDAVLIDSHTYAIDAPEGKSFARIPDGSNNWVDPVPTPGEPNLIVEEINVEESGAILVQISAEEGEEGYENAEEEISSSVTIGGGAGAAEAPTVEKLSEEDAVVPVIEAATTTATTTEKIITPEVFEQTATSTENIEGFNEATAIVAEAGGVIELKEPIKNKEGGEFSEVKTESLENGESGSGASVKE